MWAGERNASPCIHTWGPLGTWTPELFVFGFPLIAGEERSSSFQLIVWKSSHKRREAEQVPAPRPRVQDYHLLCSYFDPYHVILTALGLYGWSGSCPQGLFLCLEDCDD